MKFNAEHTGYSKKFINFSVDSKNRIFRNKFHELMNKHRKEKREHIHS